VSSASIWLADISQHTVQASAQGIDANESGADGMARSPIVNWFAWAMFSSVPREMRKGKFAVG
jgi:hypothetical protein